MKAVRAVGFERIELERLRSQVGQLFATLQEAAEEFAASAPGAWTPPVDLCESEDVVTVHVELPGVEAEQIEVVITSAQLRIRGEKKCMPDGRPSSHLCSERRCGSFNRIVPLHWPVDVSGSAAELRRGVLTVLLPKQLDRRGAEFRLPVEVREE